MTSAGGLGPDERDALHAATKLLIKAAGGIDPCAVLTGVSRSRLGQYAERGADHEPLAWMPLDRVAAIERFAARPLVTEALARLQGCVLMPVPAPLPGGLAAQIAAVLTETGEAVRAIGVALGDGVMTPDEAARCIKEIDEARRALEAVRAHCEIVIDEARG